MSVKQKPLRKIVVDGQSYLWKIEHDHHAVKTASSQGQEVVGCREVFSAFLAGHRTSPLRIRFPDGPGQSAGYPAAGVVWTSGPAGLSANLNTPRLAACLIRLALAHGWKPEQSKVPLIVEDGFFFLKELPLE